MRLCFVIPALLAFGLAGCACRNPDNTPLLALLDRNVHPETAEAQVALGVVFVPVSVAAAVVDIVAVHPARCLVFAADDTWYAIWADAEGTFVEQSLTAIPKVAVTPVIYSFCWLGRSLFDIPRRQEGQRQ